MPLTNAEKCKRYRERNREKVRAADRERKRTSREKKAVRPRIEVSEGWPEDPAGAVAEWSREKLIVPPGHPLAGQALQLPDYGLSFLRDVFTHRESLLCLARKNAKSAIVAVLLLAHLAGPLRRLGWRAGVVSITKEKAGELKKQCQEIAEASALGGLRFLRSPAPGRLYSAFGSVDILSADSSSGHASGFDLSLIDEIGLLRERDRDLVAGMRSAISAKDGRFVSLSIHGDGPFIPEILQRHNAGDPSLAVHLYQADAEAALDDEKAWAAANPGLAAGIKSHSYMRDEARRVSITVSDQANFRAHELNIPGSPAREMLCTPDDWKACETANLPPREGPVCVGFDLGGSSSMSAFVALFGNGRMESFAAFPATPNLRERGEADSTGSLYERMQERRELAVYSGRVVPVGEFLKDCAARIAGCQVIAVGADRYRKAEALQAFEAAGVRWPIHWRGTGASATADGSHDVRAFQKRVYQKRIQTPVSLLIRSAIAESEITRKDGNPKLNKSRHHSRIDVLQAAVIAAGLAELTGNKPRQSWRYLGAV